MAYTEFRKSYGDFEVVIPPVKFQLPTRICSPRRQGAALL